MNGHVRTCLLKTSPALSLSLSHTSYNPVSQSDHPYSSPLALECRHSGEVLRQINRSRHIEGILTKPLRCFVSSVPLEKIKVILIHLPY
jgi:hypothetical protein